jgi:transposase-like protein
VRDPSAEGIVRYVGRQHWDAIANGLRPDYTAPTEAAAQAWRDRYPAIIQLWHNAWAEFVPFLAFDAEIRTVVCSRTRSRVSTPGSAGLSALGATSRTKPPR